MASASMSASPNSTDVRRRVKVYSFNENLQWEDMGTGHVSMTYVERLQSLTIIVRSEEDGECVCVCVCDCACVCVCMHVCAN